MDDKNTEVRKPDEELSAREVWRNKTRGENSGAAAGSTVYYGEMPGTRKMRFSQGGRKPFLIFAAVIVAIILLGVLCRLAGIGTGASGDMSGASQISGDHIGVLYIEGEIGSTDGEYNHQYLLDAIDGMMDNDDNRGMMLYVETPGGGVYESDELYLKIKQYQENTERPVYAYFASQATSGGYYVSACADKITANRNCWTGSIGVTIGTLFDISGLLEKYGIKTETITSGENKAMGSMTEPMSEEQRQIFQSLVDDAYEQFVSIVAEGRDLDIAYVKEIADGRIYTASQAKSIGLVDDIVNTYDDAVEDMIDEFFLSGCEVYEFRYEPEAGLLDTLMKSVDKASGAVSGGGDIDALMRLLEQNDELPIQYMCKEIK